jgi:hypothetical protein
MIREARQPVADPADRPGHADMDIIGPDFLAEDAVGHREIPGPSLGEPPPGYRHVLLAGFQTGRTRHGFPSNLAR